MKNDNEVDPLTWIEYLSFIMLLVFGWALYQLPNIKKIIHTVSGAL